MSRIKKLHVIIFFITVSILPQLGWSIEKCNKLFQETSSKSPKTYHGKKNSAYKTALELIKNTDLEVSDGDSFFQGGRSKRISFETFMTGVKKLRMENILYQTEESFVEAKSKRWKYSTKKKEKVHIAVIIEVRTRHPETGKKVDVQFSLYDYYSDLGMHNELLLKANEAFGHSSSYQPNFDRISSHVVMLGKEKSSEFAQWGEAGSREWYRDYDETMTFEKADILPDNFKIKNAKPKKNQ